MNSRIVLDAINPKRGPGNTWKATVPSKEIIGCVYEASLPSEETTFVELKRSLQENAKIFFAQKSIPGTRRKLSAQPRVRLTIVMDAGWSIYLLSMHGTHSQRLIRTEQTLIPIFM